MAPSIPAPIVEADRVHNQVLREISFSKYLNPLNGEEARQAFMRGASSPPFLYEPLVDADKWLRRLDCAPTEREHPAGILVHRCITHTQDTIRALRDRTASAFHLLAVSNDWYPEPELMDLSFPEATSHPGPLDVSAEDLIAHLEDALLSRGARDWKVLRDRVMSARVLVDGAKRVLRVNPDALFRQRDLDRLVAHEIDVHVLRSIGGQTQQLRCFETGLPGSLTTEEGLAMVAEEQTGTDSPGVLSRQLEVLRAIQMAREMGFRELFSRLEETLGQGLSWGICLRIKRGLARPDLPGVYAKDSVYLRGRMRVTAWLDAGGSLADLYVGKVGIDDPVSDWIEQGWIQPASVQAPEWGAQA
jgi:hypothetical protein